jgi:hypothetical protein
VLDMALLIMVTLSMVSPFSSTCGCFLQVERSFPRAISLLFSLACGWPLGRMALCLANGGASNNLGSKDLRGARQRRLNRPPEWAILARFGRAFALVGPHVFMHFPPSICTILTMSSSHPRWRLSLHEVRSFTLQFLGMFLCNTLVLTTIGSDFIMRINTNKTP